MRLIFRNAALGVLLLCGFFLSSCKTRGVGVAELSSINDKNGGKDSFRGLLCSPTKKLYFHWMPLGIAAHWFETAGTTRTFSGTELAARTGNWTKLNATLFDSIFTAGSKARNVCGGGVYLSGGPTDSAEFGDTLILFRMTSPSPKGASCQDAFGADCFAMNMHTPPEARSSLPLLLRYQEQIGRVWYLVPRIGNESQGESVEFDIPHQGDAEAVAKELIDGKTVKELLQNLAEVLPQQVAVGKKTLKGLCQNPPASRSFAFLKQLFCDAIPERFDRTMKNLAPDPKSDISREELNSLWEMQKKTYGPDYLNSPKAAKIMRSYYWLPPPDGQ